jgi:hypothetical protein
MVGRHRDALHPHVGQVGKIGLRIKLHPERRDGSSVDDYQLSWLRELIGGLYLIDVEGSPCMHRSSLFPFALKGK